MRRVAATVAVTVLCSCVGVDVARAVEDTETARIPGTEIALDYPSDWQAVSIPQTASVKGVRAFLKRNPWLTKATGADPSLPDKSINAFRQSLFRYLEMARYDPVTGDNVFVAVEHAKWWKSFSEFKALAKAVGKMMGAKPGAVDAETSVGTQPAFTHLERNSNGIHAGMSVKQVDRGFVTINVVTDGDDPAVAQAIMNSVHSVAPSK